ncbi:putative AC transposase [Bienertia sinuspersici]
MKVKWYTYFNEFSHIYDIAAILDPGVKIDGLTKLLTFYYELLGITYDIAYHVNKYKFILDRYELYRYVNQPEFIGSSSRGKSRFGFVIGHVLKNQRTSSSSSSSSVGVDKYLYYQFETEDEFRIIQWWKNHSSTFRVLSRIAKDIHVILASTIASESVCSAGRRVLDEIKISPCSPKQ